MPSALRPLILVVAATACASRGGGDFSASAVLRPAEEAPERFEISPPAVRIPPADTVGGVGCTSPLVDPRDGFTIRFLRSAVLVGDYEVAGGRYGVGAGELLRVECNTGVPLGVVAR